MSRYSYISCLPKIKEMICTLWIYLSTLTNPCKYSLRNIFFPGSQNHPITTTVDIYCINHCLLISQISDVNSKSNVTLDRDPIQAKYILYRTQYDLCNIFVITWICNYCDLSYRNIFTLAAGSCLYCIMWCRNKPQC